MGSASCLNNLNASAQKFGERYVERVAKENERRMRHEGSQIVVKLAKQLLESLVVPVVATESNLIDRETIDGHIFSFFSALVKSLSKIVTDTCSNLAKEVQAEHIAALANPEFAQRERERRSVPEEKDGASTTDDDEVESKEHPSSTADTQRPQSSHQSSSNGEVVEATDYLKHLSHITLDDLEKIGLSRDHATSVLHSLKSKLKEIEEYRVQDVEEADEWEQEEKKLEIDMVALEAAAWFPSTIERIEAGSTHFIGRIAEAASALVLEHGQRFAEEAARVTMGKLQPMPLAEEAKDDAEVTLKDFFNNVMKHEQSKVRQSRREKAAQRSKALVGAGGNASRGGTFHEDLQKKLATAGLEVFQKVGTDLLKELHGQAGRIAIRTINTKLSSLPAPSGKQQITGMTRISIGSSLSCALDTLDQETRDATCKLVGRELSLARRTFLATLAADDKVATRVAPLALALHCSAYFERLLTMFVSLANTALPVINEAAYSELRKFVDSVIMEGAQEKAAEIDEDGGISMMSVVLDEDELEDRIRFNDEVNEEHEEHDKFEQVIGMMSMWSPDSALGIELAPPALGGAGSIEAGAPIEEIARLMPDVLKPGRASAMHEQNFSIMSAGDDKPSYYVPSGVWVTGAPLVWEQGYKGAGCIVAVIDTGVDGDHPDLVANVKKHRSYVGNGPLHHHGTHVAGTIAANGVIKGVAPAATIYDYRVFDTYGRSRAGVIPKAIRDAVDDGCNVINMSLGGKKDDQALYEAIKYAHDKGVLCVVASGNDSGSVDWNTSVVSYPASYEEALSVGAVAYCVERGEVDLANTKFSNANPDVNLAADGYKVLSTVPGGGYHLLDGTSMACPHVSGAAALLFSKATFIGGVPPAGCLHAMVQFSCVPIDVSKYSGEDDLVNNIVGGGLCTFFPQIPTHTENGFELPTMNRVAPEKHSELSDKLSGGETTDTDAGNSDTESDDDSSHRRQSRRRRRRSRW